MRKSTIGGGVFILAGAFLGRSTLQWILDKALDALTVSAGGNLTWATFPWANALGVVLMVVGAWLVFSDRGGDEQKETDRLYAQMRPLYERLQQCSDQFDPEVLGEIVSLIFRLECQKIVSPSLSGLSWGEVYRISRSYVGALMPMIRDGHLGQARIEAPRIIIGAGATPAPLLKSRIPFMKPSWKNYAYERLKQEPAK